MKCKDCISFKVGQLEDGKYLCTDAIGVETWDTYWGAPWVKGEDEACKNYKEKVEI